MARTDRLMRLMDALRRLPRPVTAAVLAFVPEFLFISSAVSNDNAAAFFGTAALWGAFRRTVGNDGRDAGTGSQSSWFAGRLS